ncbi:Hydrolase PA4440, alpha/beta fold family [hydrothermal vent metagenome]|uniref:Hydrolase PA4440, alpha/beta fold family n=1 Tax=hydrothermal vent metagenome TaxID=652676 RepID=A0A3B1A5N0_9ZZZZ
MSADKSQDEGLHVFNELAGLPASGACFLIPGPTGVLEAMLTYSVPPTAFSPIAVVCHPHPLYGGTLSNKVVHMVSKAFNALGVMALRFNFRGVGHSDGRFDHGVGEVQDMLAAVSWVRQHFARSPLWLAGFSFGSFVAYSGYRQAGAEQLLLVAPPVDRFKFAQDRGVDVPWMVIQGGADEVVNPESVSLWVAQQPQRPVYECLDDASHFFHSRLVPLRERIVRAWG